MSEPAISRPPFQITVSHTPADAKEPVVIARVSTLVEVLHLALEHHPQPLVFKSNLRRRETLAILRLVAHPGYIVVSGSFVLDGVLVGTKRRLFLDDMLVYAKHHLPDVGISSVDPKICIPEQVIQCPWDAHITYPPTPEPPLVPFSEELQQKAVRAHAGLLLAALRVVDNPTQNNLQLFSAYDQFLFEGESGCFGVLQGVDRSSPSVQLFDRYGNVTGLRRTVWEAATRKGSPVDANAWSYSARSYSRYVPFHEPLMPWPFRDDPDDE